MDPQEKVPDTPPSFSEEGGEPSWQVDAGAPSVPHEVAPPEETPPDPMRILEAMLFVGGKPLTSSRACAILRGLTPEQFAQAIDSLNQDYRRQGRPYLIQAQEEGYLLALRPKYREVIEKVYGGPREARLSTTAIDVLALVAYQQPATKGEIDSLRGAESGSLLRQLVRRGLIQVGYRGEGKEREVTYATTSRFLQLFGLSTLEDLPRTQDWQQI
jgi:segregation and condensation protein B